MARLEQRAYFIVEGVRIALDALKANRVRAGLTILGIAVGVFVVVVISAAVHGINVSVAKDLESTGPSTFYVQRYPITFEACDGSGDTCTWRQNPPITFSELASLNRIPGVATAGAAMFWAGSVKYRDRQLPSASIESYTGNWSVLGAPDMADGRAFTEQEAKAAARVVVLTTVTAERLFAESDPIGKELKVNGTPFTVIGVFRDNASFLSGGSSRAKIVMPIQSLARHLNVRISDMGVAVKPRDGYRQDEVIDDVMAAMRGARGLRPGRESNFAIITQDKIMDVYNKIFGMFFLVMISLSAVGLLVGGVGVVAIMMISVTERTREIGVRKALGATRGMILLQFLIEAVTLTGIGGAIGLFVGWGVALLVRQFSPIAASVPPLAVVAALGASAVTGILFGMLPAMKASKLDPVDALRYE